MIWHWLLNHVGVTDASGTWYLWWSGFVGDLTIFAAVLIAVRHRNCHVRGCWRLGHPDPDHGHPACRRHHSRAHLLERTQP